MRRNIRGTHGFSLAEVLVAMALLSVIVMSVVALTAASMKRAYAGRKMTEGAVLAQSIMERVGQPQAHQLMPTVAGAGVTVSASQRRIIWTRTAGAVVPAAEGGGTPAEVERNVWRTMFANAELPTGSAAGQRAQMSVDVTAHPAGAGRTFNNAAMLRIAVDVRWAEQGVRVRTVHLESLNIP